MLNTTIDDNMFHYPTISIPGIFDSSDMLLSYLGAAVLLLLLAVQLQPPRNKAPIINPKKWSEWTWERSMRDFTFGSKAMLSQAYATFGNKPYQVYTSQGMLTVLGPKYINEIKNDDRLSLPEHIHRAFLGDIPGFLAFDQSIRGRWYQCLKRKIHEGSLLVPIANKHLTTYLNQMTKSLSEECDLTLKQHLHDSPDWHIIDPNEQMSRVIARMSSRIFLGKEFCEDERWIEASRQYAITLFSAQERLSLWPSYLRPVVHWFLPYCKNLRQNASTCRSIIDDVLERRKIEQAALRKQGKPPRKFEDTLTWMEQLSQGNSIDPTKVQLGLSMAAIHTTTDLTSWLLICIAQHPEILQPLREEIASVLSAGGWKKTSLYNLKLLDSVMKESQRLKPNVLATMRRRAMKDITLSDGTFIPRKTMTLVYSPQMRDPNIYPKPDVFDPYRFYNMRNLAGKENLAQFVSTSPQHMGFSYGVHSCPGRFFAANETKILLCHLLLKYDIRLAKGSPADSIAFGFALIPNPEARLEIRRRKEEIDLTQLEV